MASLVYFIDRVRSETELTGPETTLGRSSDCTIKIGNDSEISRLHCTIHRRDDSIYVLIDANSRNGTFVNGARVLNDEYVLCDGDEIRIGKTRLKFFNPQGGRTTLLFEEVERELEQGKGYHTILADIKRQS